MFMSFFKRVLPISLASMMVMVASSTSSLADQDDWDRVDDVRFTHRDQEHVVSLRGEGRLDRIGFKARGTDIRCHNIRIIFRNGRIQYLDGRRYGEDHLVRFDLIGDDRRIEEVHFDCRPLGRNHGRLVIRVRR